MTEPLTLTKLIILYMLDRVDFPLSKAQIFDFVLNKEYTNYFTLQQASCELTDSGFVAADSMHSVTLLTITDSGKDTLKYFQGRISDKIRSDVEAYLSEHKMELHNEVSVTSDYYRVGTGEYVAELSAREKNSELITLKLTAPTEEAAETICENWKKQCQEIYSNLLGTLL